MFKKILNFLKKLLKWLLPILLIAGVVAAVFFPSVLPLVGSYLSTAWSAVSGWVGSAFSSVASWGGSALTAIGSYLSSASFGEVIKLATGAAILVDPEGVGAGLGNAAQGIGGAASSVVRAIPTAVWVGGGLLLAFLLLRDRQQ